LKKLVEMPLKPRSPVMEEARPEFCEPTAIIDQVVVPPPNVNVILAVLRGANHPMPQTQPAEDETIEDSVEPSLSSGVEEAGVAEEGIYETPDSEQDNTDRLSPTANASFSTPQGDELSTGGPGVVSLPLAELSRSRKKTAGRVADRFSECDTFFPTRDLEVTTTPPRPSFLEPGRPTNTSALPLPPAPPAPAFLQEPGYGAPAEVDWIDVAMDLIDTDSESSESDDGSSGCWSDSDFSSSEEWDSPDEPSFYDF